MVFLPHMAWLAATALFVASCIRMARASARCHRVFRIALFAIVLGNEGTWFAYRHFVLAMPRGENLPLHLCDLSVFALLAGIATGWRPFAEWAYYPGVVGALLAVVFPAVSETGAIRAVAEVRYFVTHIALVGAGLYFTFGCGYYPPARAIVRVYLAIAAYAVAVTPLNMYLGTNYFFTISAPKEVAFIHAYPHWLFLAAVSAIFLAAFGLMHLPFVRMASRNER